MNRNIYILLIIFFMMPIMVFADECKSDDIVLKSIDVSARSGNSEEITPASIESNKINLNLKFSDVGDYIQYRVVVENSSSEDYEFNPNAIGDVSDYVSYEFVNVFGSNLIKSGTSKTFQLRVLYNNEVPEEEFKTGKYSDSKEIVINLSNNNDIKNPETGYKTIIVVFIVLLLSALLSILALKNIKLNMNIILIVLAFLMPISIAALCKYDVIIDSNVAIEKSEYYVYTSNDKNIAKCKIGESIPDGVTTYDDAISVGKNPIIRHKIIGGQIAETSVGIYSNAVNDYLYLTGSGATYNIEENKYNGDSPFYLQNKLTLFALYGTNGCSEKNSGNYSTYECNWVRAHSDGSIWAQLDCKNGCAIDADGTSYCGAVAC